MHSNKKPLRCVSLVFVELCEEVSKMSSAILLVHIKSFNICNEALAVV